MKKLLLIGSLFILGACSSVKTPEEEVVAKTQATEIVQVAEEKVVAKTEAQIKEEELKKEKGIYTEEEVRNWEKTIITKAIADSYISEWYGNENPINYIIKNGKLSQKNYKFISSLKEKEAITEKERKTFTKIVNKAVGKLEREFWLEETNIKNPKGLVDKMVTSSYMRMRNPSNHISMAVASEKEWAEIVEFSKKQDLNEKDVKNLRKLLNKFIKRENLLDENSWYAAEISERLEEIITKSKASDLSKDQRNNINAKALYIAYPEYFSTLDKWKD